MDGRWRGKPRRTTPAMVDVECERKISGGVGRRFVSRLGGRRLLRLKALLRMDAGQWLVDRLQDRVLRFGRRQSGLKALVDR